MFKFGWKRDLPDFRDLSSESPEVRVVLEKTKNTFTGAKAPLAVDLRKWCSPIEDQGDLGSCTANAGVGLLEYFQKRAYNKYLNGSRLFLYKTTRNLEKVRGDSGAYLRDTMKAMVLFGVPPEEYCPYSVTKFDDEPTAFMYSLGRNFSAIKYYRLDPAGITPQNLLADVKSQLVKNLPSMFGFTVYSSISNAAEIPYPVKGDKVLGGHAVMCCGFDDTKAVGNQVGALLIRNSWGTSWGDRGYGWLPYAYVNNGLAVDFWTLVEAGFVNTDLFK